MNAWDYFSIGFGFLFISFWMFNTQWNKEVTASNHFEIALTRVLYRLLLFIGAYLWIISIFVIFSNLVKKLI